MFIRLSQRSNPFTVMVFTAVLTAFMAAQLVLPLTAMSQVVSNTSSKAFEPWLKSDMKWDGGWGAFNDRQSERASGGCALMNKQVKPWTELIGALAADAQKIASDPKLKKNPRAAFKRAYSTRLAGKKFENSAPAVPGATGIAPIVKRSMGGTPDSFEAFMGRANSSTFLGGCNQADNILKNVIRNVTPNPIELFKAPGTFILRLFLWPFALIGTMVYSITGPIALGMTLTTPHTERGDTLYNTWNIYATTATSADAQKNLFNPNKPQSMACDDRQAGFNCKAAGGPSSRKELESSPWVGLAMSLRYALSAVYGVIVIAVALAYIFRKDPGSAYDVKKVIPRVFMAVTLSAAAPFFIGLCITMSNWIVQGVLANSAASNGVGSANNIGFLKGGAGAIPNQITQAIYSTGTAGGGSTGGLIGSTLLSTFVTGFLPPLLIVAFAIGFVMLIVIAVVKQLALIVLIIAAPLAILSLVIEKFEHAFAFWMRSLVALCALPVIQALFLAMGLAVSNIFWNPVMTGTSADVSADAGNPLIGPFISAIVLAVSIRMMIKAATMMRGYATGVQKPGGTVRAALLRGGGAALGAAATAVGAPPMVGAAIYRASNSMADKAKSGNGGFIPKTQGGGMMGKAQTRQGDAGLLSKGMDEALEELEKNEKVGIFADNYKRKAQKDMKMRKYQVANQSFAAKEAGYWCHKHQRPMNVPGPDGLLSCSQCATEKRRESLNGGPMSFEEVNANLQDAVANGDTEAMTAASAALDELAMQGKKTTEQATQAAVDKAGPVEPKVKVKPKVEWTSDEWAEHFGVSLKEGHAIIGESSGGNAVIVTKGTTKPVKGTAYYNEVMGRKTRVSQKVGGATDQALGLPREAASATVEGMKSGARRAQTAAAVPASAPEAVRGGVRGAAVASTMGQSAAVGAVTGAASSAKKDVSDRVNKEGRHAATPGDRTRRAPKGTDGGSRGY